MANKELINDWPMTMWKPATTPSVFAANGIFFWLSMGDFIQLTNELHDIIGGLPPEYVPMWRRISNIVSRAVGNVRPRADASAGASNDAAVQLTMEDYAELIRELNDIENGLSRGVVPFGQKSWLRCIQNIVGRGSVVCTNNVRLANNVSAAASKITRAEIQDAIGCPLDDYRVGFYCCYDLADMKAGWPRGYRETYGNQPFQEMHRIIRTQPTMSDFELLMVVSMETDDLDFPGEYQWTRRRPFLYGAREGIPYDQRVARGLYTGNGYIVGNVVLVSGDGRIVTDKNKWFGVCELDAACGQDPRQHYGVPYALHDKTAQESFSAELQRRIANQHSR